MSKAVCLLAGCTWSPPLSKADPATRYTLYWSNKPFPWTPCTTLCIEIELCFTATSIVCIALCTVLIGYLVCVLNKYRTFASAL